MKDLGKMTRRVCLLQRVFQSLMNALLQRNGKGKFTDSEGTYEGNWRDDMKDGDGQFFYTGTPAGRKYYGAWKADMVHIPRNFILF